MLVPSERTVGIDTVSTWGEHSEASRRAMLEFLVSKFPGWRVKVQRPSWIIGDKRVMNAVRAQIRLRAVLQGTNFEEISRSLGRLGTIGSLMEKESRVMSWSVRTVGTPLLAAAGVVAYGIAELFLDQVGEAGVTLLRYGILSVLGAAFLYLGMKAVQLTEMANRVWKRSREYDLIVSERKRLANPLEQPASESVDLPFILG